jgi:exopolysaccharide biosynthesis WecB/TagA/CpsF family protein
VVVVKDLGKRNVTGILIDAVDYEAAVSRILDAAKERRPFAASALAVHGVMTGVLHTRHGYRLNSFDLLTPDGQPVLWALNLLYRTGLSERVYGPKLMLRVCETAAREGIPIYLYGSNEVVLEKLKDSLSRHCPDLSIVGVEPSKFRRTTLEEKRTIANRIRDSGAGIVFVGLGCPRQEVFAYEYREALGIPLVAVGAAFEYHAGTLREPPELVQRAGLQWLYRLVQDPKRLWRRYTILSGGYVALVALQAIGVKRLDPSAFPQPETEIRYG